MYRQNDEFIPAHAAHIIIGPEIAFQCLYNFDQNLVSGLMAVGVIDCFEIVDVDHQEPQRPVVCPGQFHLAQQAKQSAAVIALSQMVAQSLTLELFVLNEDFAPQQMGFPQSAQTDAQQRAQLAAQQNPDVLRDAVSGQRADVFQRRNRPDKQSGGKQQK